MDPEQFSFILATYIFGIVLACIFVVVYLNNNLSRRDIEDIEAGLGLVKSSKD